jgi:hypothetical protein
MGNRDQKASAVCPLNVLPEASVMVPETMIGILIFFLPEVHQWQKCCFCIQGIENGFYQKNI